jgi:cobalamin biosynthesis protein CobT
MARRRTKSHLELREQFDAAERKKDEDEPEEEEAEDEDEDEDEEESEEAEGGEAEEAGDDDEGGDEDDEDAPRKKKKKKAAKPPKPAKEVKPKRSRAPKVVRMKVVWAVFNNSNQRVATYDYPKRKDAEDHAERLRTDKKATFFVQPVKEPIVEKKE